jgi:hypothetical protein
MDFPEKIVECLGFEPHLNFFRNNTELVHAYNLNQT